MRIRDYDTSFAALGASLESSSSLLDSSWNPFGGSWMGLGSSSGALGDALGLETLYFQKMRVSLRREHDFGNLSEQGTGSACG